MSVKYVVCRAWPRAEGLIDCENQPSLPDLTATIKLRERWNSHRYSHSIYVCSLASLHLVCSAYSFHTHTQTHSHPVPQGGKDLACLSLKLDDRHWGTNII